MGVVDGGLKGNWGTVLAAVVESTDAGGFAACQRRRAAGVFLQWSRRTASSPVVVAAAGIAGGRLKALDRLVGSWDAGHCLDGRRASRRQMFLVLVDGRRLTGAGGARAGKYQMEATVAGLAAVALVVLLGTGCADQGNETLAGKELSALRRSRELPAAVEVALLDFQ